MKYKLLKPLTALLALAATAGVAQAQLQNTDQVDLSMVDLGDGAAKPLTNAPRYVETSQTIPVAAAAPEKGSPQWSVSAEVGNDSWLKPVVMSDKNFSSDLRLTVNRRDADGRGSWQGSLIHTIYTPATYHIGIDGTRSYAALLSATGSRIVARENNAQAFSLSAGVIGKNAFGEQVQNGWHAAKGKNILDWSVNEIKDGFLVNAGYSRADVVSKSENTRLATRMDIGGGTMAQYLRGGLTFQVASKGVPAELPDYAGNSMHTPRLHLASTDTAKKGVSAFFGLGVKGVLYDWSLDKSRSNAKRLPVVPEAGAGTTAQFGKISFGYKLTWTGKEYKMQGAGPKDKDNRNSTLRAVMNLGYRF